MLSLGGAKYSVDFHDDFSRWTDIDFLVTKDLTQGAYEKYETRLATQTGAKIGILRTDRGTEFLNKRFSTHLESKGTVRELTVHDTHEQVGVAERFNRTKAERARALLMESHLPRFLWAEAMNHVVWLKNRTPTRALLGRTPFESKFGSKPDLASILPFGAPAWVKIVDAGKLDAHAKQGHFVGYDSESRGYRIYLPEQRRVSVEREVVFDKDDLKKELTLDDEVDMESEKSKESVEANGGEQREKKKEGSIENVRLFPNTPPRELAPPAPTSNAPTQPIRRSHNVLPDAIPNTG